MTEEKGTEQNLPKVNVGVRRPRTTTILTVVHQAPDDDPVEIDSRTSRECATAEDAYRRNLIVKSKSWTHIDCGWMKDVGTLVIENRKDGGCEEVVVGLHTGPTEDEKKRRTMHDAPLPAVMVLRLGSVPAGDAIRIVSPEMDRIVLYSPSEKDGRVKVTLLPK